MAAPDTSFQPTPPREERHPGVDLREHPVSPADGWGRDGRDCLGDSPWLAFDAHAADVRAAQAIAAA